MVSWIPSSVFTMSDFDVREIDMSQPAEIESKIRQSLHWVYELNHELETLRVANESLRATNDHLAAINESLAGPASEAISLRQTLMEKQDSWNCEALKMAAEIESLDESLGFTDQLLKVERGRHDETKIKLKSMIEKYDELKRNYDDACNILGADKNAEKGLGDSVVRLMKEVNDACDGLEEEQVVSAAARVELQRSQSWLLASVVLNVSLGVALVAACVWGFI